MFPHYSPITNKGKPNLLPIVFPVFDFLEFDEQYRRSVIDAYIENYEIKDLNSVYFVANDFENHYLKRLTAFRDSLKKESAVDVLVHYMKDKKRSMSSSDFWALTRLAAAVREQSDERLMQGLAFYDCIAKELKISGGKLVENDAKKEFIALMQKRRHFRGLSMAKQAEEKIRIIIQNQDSLISLNEIEDVAATERMMVETFSEWYLMTEDDNVRNVVIGFHSLYQMREISPNYKIWLQEFWLQAQVFSLMTKKSVLWKKTEIRTWEQLREEAQKLTKLEDIYFFYVLNDFNDKMNIEFLRRGAQLVIDNA